MVPHEPTHNENATEVEDIDADVIVSSQQNDMENNQSAYTPISTPNKLKNMNE